MCQKWRLSFTVSKMAVGCDVYASCSGGFDPNLTGVQSNTIEEICWTDRCQEYLPKINFESAYTLSTNYDAYHIIHMMAYLKFGCELYLMRNCVPNFCSMTAHFAASRLLDSP